MIEREIRDQDCSVSGSLSVDDGSTADIAVMETGLPFCMIETDVLLCSKLALV